MTDECRTVGVYIGSDGVLVWGWDIDDGVVDEELALEKRLAGVPHHLRGRLEAATRMGGSTSVYWQLSSVIWRLPEDSSWQIGAESGDDGGDVALSLFSDLTDPSPGTIMWSSALGVERASFSLAVAVRHILAMRPLTEEVVRSLNPAKGRAEVVNAVAATGYAAAEQAPAQALDRGMGENAPLVSGARETEMWGEFLLEPDGDGFHRILVRHSGKALDVIEVPDAVLGGATVVQSEPHNGDSQKFLLQVLLEGTFHDIREATHFNEEDGEGPEDGTRYRIIAKGSGLALQAGLKQGEPVVLAEPYDKEDQTFIWSPRFGYGFYGNLRFADGLISIRSSSVPYS